MTAPRAALPAGLFAPDILADPYPMYADLRARSGAFWQAHPQGEGGMWMFTRHADVEQVLKDTRLTKDASRVRDVGAQAMPGHMLDRDPPDHTRMRKLVAHAFTPRVIEEQEGHIRDIARTLLEQVAPGEPFEAMTGYAMPLPVIVIAELLGVPPEDRELFRRWSGDFIDGGDFATATPESAARAQQGIMALGQYFGELVETRRAQPRDDLISHLVRAEDELGALRPGELVSNCLLLVIAGHETTVNLIGNGLKALLDHPQELERLRAQPALMPGAIEEMLRYDPPVQRALFRAALEDVEIGGQHVGQGEQVSAIIGAANRDPAAFVEPDRFDIGRSPNRHLSFGRGLHFCLGAPLAKLEARVAFEEVLKVFPRMELKSFTRRPSTMFRGLGELWVESG
ncbi:cytochrome P450 [Deinococcus koreensis]|uniref:Cytochrome P450 n=1 Tax=Deinococcus koreensis TaxID=2054903 RepID=A0A2K3UXI1_9DEIO|nr:cytochrome P450 [Deinococcus koreensis]PNY81234.1 cytochrome P450 [Deinococcus koreensis]